jgi:predicted phage tail component-like protein
LTSFHEAFNSFCKDYFPAERLFGGCHEEFSLIHKDSSSREIHISDEASIVEENIYHEDHEVLNDIHYDRNNIEMSSIISDVSFVLNVHEDQHICFEYSDDEEKVYYVVDISLDYEVEIDDKLVKITREVSSLFIPRFLELKANFVCFSCEENAEDIFIL